METPTAKTIQRCNECQQADQQCNKLTLQQCEAMGVSEEKPKDISYPVNPDARQTRSTSQLEALSEDFASSFSLQTQSSAPQLQTLSEDFASSEGSGLARQTTIKPVTKDEFMHRAEQMKEEELSSIDINNDGAIDKSEFKHAFCKKEADAMFSALDYDNDGSITFEEFMDQVTEIISEDFEALADHRGLVSNELANQILRRTNNQVAVFPGQDSDGMVTKQGLLSEVAKNLKHQFNAVDVDGNGSIQRAELEEYWGHILSEEFDQLDANRDGVIDEDELAAVVEKKFDRFDLNHDGVIDADELTPLAANAVFSRHIEIVDPTGLILKDLGSHVSQSEQTHE